MREPFINVNGRPLGERRKTKSDPPPHFRLTCASCEATATVHGREAAARWLADHKATHTIYAKQVFVHQELLRTEE